MNTKLTLLSIASITFMAGVSLQPASAQNRAGARFNFAPNIWRMEDSSIPEGYCHPRAPIGHAVQSGHVPSSKDILGLDPGSLPVVTPSVQTQTRAAVRQVTPTHYQETFGAPTNAPVMAALPKTATPLSLRLPKEKEGDKALSANKAVSGKLMHANKNNLFNTRLAGKLLRKNHAAGQSGQTLALKPTSYGKNFGYEPGPVMPSSYGNGMNVKTAVSGTLLHRNRK